MLTLCFTTELLLYRLEIEHGRRPLDGDYRIRG